MISQTEKQRNFLKTVDNLIRFCKLEYKRRYTRRRLLRYNVFCSSTIEIAR